MHSLRATPRLTQPRGVQLSQRFRQRVVSVRATVVEDEIDPTTGQAYENPQVRRKLPEDYVQAGNLKWAYRKSSAGGAPEDKKAPILLLHGIGSNSYCYRDLMRLLSQGGHDCYAPDWPGHGSTEKPADFEYTEAAYVAALADFVEAVGLQEPFCVVAHGFVLGQYGLLWALTCPTSIQNLVILGTPLGTATPLRPELAPYKSPLPFLRPKSDSKFAGDLFNAAGLAYAISYDDAQAYERPYAEEPAANAAIAKTMEALDWKKLLQKVDEGFLRWRVPSAVLYGNKDEFLDIGGAVEWLSSKRTCMQLASIEGKLGHCPQEDFADAFSPLLLDFFAGEDITVKGTKKFKKDADATPA